YMGGRWATLVRSAVLLGCALPDAEDVVQTTLARCYAAWPKVSRAGNRDAYVYRMLVNALVDSRRRRWWGERPTAMLPDRADVADPLSDVDVTDAVERALAGLTSDHRAVIVLRFYAHLSEQETALALGIALGTVKSRTSRALAQLADNQHLTDLADGNTP
ncbi:MAG: SigE family RNA polymerase sigma factor, partial [Actinomycetota bacterium]|nr:SigE family RNA polymerase sigma factor [Actinomycetota bacterium]